MQMAVAEAYASLTYYTAETPQATKVVPYTTDGTSGDYFSFPIFSPVYAQPMAESTTSGVELDGLCSTAHPDSTVELKWTQGNNSKPSVNYLPPTATSTPMPQDTWINQGETEPLQLDEVSENSTRDLLINSTNPDPWRPVLEVTGTEPDWVLRRNATLQRMLDSAAPLFSFTEEAGNEMCNTCIEHFDQCNTSLVHSGLKQ
jgi:hypothetical protein